VDDGTDAAGRPTDRWVLDHLPAAVLVVDESAVVVAGSQRAADLAGYAMEDFIGASILEFVDPDAIWAYAAAMNVAMDSTTSDVYGGPVRIAVQGPEGRKVAADLWSSNQIGIDGPQAMVLMLTEQTVALGVAEAIALAATGASYEDVSIVVAGALAGFPVIADAAVFTAGPDGPELLASQVPSSLVDGTAGDDAWRRAIDDGTRVLYARPDTAPAPLGDLLVAAGYQALWVEPIVLGDDAPSGALAMFRRIPGEPTPNELASVFHAAASLAITRPR